MISSEFVRCPICKGKTRTKIRDDSILIRHLLYCSKCKAEYLVNIQEKSITILERLDAETQGRITAECGYPALCLFNSQYVKERRPRTA